MPPGPSPPAPPHLQAASEAGDAPLAGRSGHTLMAFTKHAPLPSPSGDSLWKRNPSTWGFQAVISSFIFQFPSRSLSASSYSHLRRAERKRKVFQPAPCSLGLSGAGTGRLSCRGGGRFVSLGDSPATCGPCSGGSQPQGLQNSPSTAQSPPRLFPQ